MSTESDMVFRGFLKLSDPEKLEFIKDFREYYTLSTDDKRHRELLAGISVALKMELGPISGGCPCCGK